MNRKLEDQLVRLSFGDLTPEEAAKLHEQISSDPEARRTVDEWKSLKSDLRMLSDVPPHQLSNERLHHAILNQGLQPRPSGSPLGWLWAPVTVGLLAFTLTVMRMKQNEPTIPGAGSSGQIVLGPDIKPPKSISPIIESPKPQVVTRNDQSDEQDLLESAAESAPVVSSPSKRSRPHAKASAAGPRLAAIGSAIAKKIDEVQSQDELALVPAPSTLVLIANDSDNDTGAKKATEVDSPADVLISG